MTSASLKIRTGTGMSFCWRSPVRIACRLNPLICWRFGDCREESTTSEFNGSSRNLSLRRIGWREFISCVESQVPPTRRSSFAEEWTGLPNHLSPSSTTGHFYPTAFLSVVYFRCSLLSIDIYLCTVILYLSSIPFRTVTILCCTLAFTVLKVVCLFVHLLFIWWYLVFMLSLALMNILQ